jgi:hypothetical protein
MSLDYAADHLVEAVRTLARGDAPLAARLQAAWTENVQMLWMKPCLTRDLLAEFKGLWERYTAASDDRRSTKLRDMTPEELSAAADEVISLSIRTSIAAANASPDTELAVLADLQ